MSEFHKNKVTEIEEAFAIGNPIFLKFFKMKDVELKEKLKSVIGEHGIFDEFYKKASLVKRIIENEAPSEIQVWFHGCMKINSFGVYFSPECGETKKLIAFNKHFKF